jgi:glycosyltransferase involved in cell wall biosynthesis
MARWLERPVRVAHLMHGFQMGGLEQLVLELCTLGRAQGVEPLVIGLGPDGPMREAAGARGIPTLWIPDAGMGRVALTKLRAALETFDADIIHAHDAGPWLNAVAVRALRPRAQVVATFHQMDMPEGTKRLAARFAATFTGAIVACGTEVREKIATWAPDHARVFTIGNGVRLPLPPGTRERTEARRRLGIPESATVVGYLGRMAEVKGPDLLLAAFLARHATRGEVHLALVGGGPLDEKLRQMAQGQANVHQPGTIVNASALLPAFDVYAQTSLSEGRSLAMLEAMAAGLPTVAHDLPGVREIHPDGTTAILAPLGEARALQDAIAALVDDPLRRSKLGSAARVASQRFSIESTLEAYVDLYRGLAFGPAAGSLELRG